MKITNRCSGFAGNFWSTHKLTSLSEKSIPLFALIQKVEQKNQGKSIPIAIGSSAGFAMAHAQIAEPNA